jgi:hypothetical protein
VAHRRGHAPYLAIAAFVDGELEPSGGDIGTVADGGIARPQLRFRHQPGRGGGGLAVFQFHPRAQGLQGVFIRFAFHLYPVGLGQFVAGMADTVLQIAVVGEDHQALAVAIEAAGGIEPLVGDKIRQGGAVFPIGKLAQDVIGFIEKQDHKVDIKAYFAKSCMNGPGAE